MTRPEDALAAYHLRSALERRAARRSARRSARWARLLALLDYGRRGGAR